ncbi:MAG: DUF2066 domain-containing protein [Alphaproteobacteria bacterium]
MFVRPRAGHVVALTFAILLMQIPPAGAQTRDVYTATGVPVDEKAADGVEAKRQGLVAGQRTGLRMVMEQITLNEDHDRLPNPGNDAIRGLVRDFSVESEKFGGGRYLAQLTVRFRADGVRQLLQERGIPFAETASGPLVVLPVYQAGGRTTLWDEPNPWLAAWGRYTMTGGLVPLKLPLGDLADVTTINAEQALAGKPENVAAIARKYGAVGALAVAGQLDPAGRDGGPLLQVSMTRYSSGMESSTIVQGYAGRAGTTQDALFDAAVADMVGQLQEAWKRENLLRPGASTSEQWLQVRVPIAQLGDWLAVRDRLNRIPTVTRTEVARLSTREAVLDLRYRGTPEQLRIAMAQQSLNLDYRQDIQNWVLMPAGGR